MASAAEIDEAADFSDADVAEEMAKKVARRGWNGENQFCWLVPEDGTGTNGEPMGYFPGDLVRMVLISP
uniref:DUF2829 domain-containing protein n=1 Tax=Salmonella sp. TaxID=599 RepID=UPI001CD98581|nr:DUF2829 domain-containing protein [Salmonella sp.]